VVPGVSILDGSDGLVDSTGHGTWLAGIVAARTDTSPLEGIAGVAFAGVQVMPVTVLNANGEGLDSDVIAGVIWAADHGADVILMAFSNRGFSPSLQDAIDYAWSKGVVLVAAVGNAATSDPTFPAGDRGVMGVAATDASDALAYFSNDGPAVFIAAPGIDIQTTDIGDAYASVSGTSTSAAIIAGAAALMKAVDPTLTNGIIVGRLARNADPAGTQSQTGNGRINLPRALADTSTEFIQPAGVAPMGDGGPFVGPYLAATTNVISVTLSPPSRTITYGTASVTYTVNIGSNGSGTVTLSTSGLPAGATASFVPTSPISCGGSGCPSVTLTLQTATVAASASTYPFTVTAQGDRNNSSPRSDTGQLTVNKANQTINFAALGNKTYGDADFTLSATATSGLAVSFGSQTTATCTVSGSTVHIVATGPCTIRASQAGDGSYDAAPTVDQSFTIAKKTASVTPNSGSKTYGDADPTLTGTLSGFVVADGVTATYSRTAGETAAGSPYTISATLSPMGVLGNYAITYNTANFTINKRTASVTPNAAGKTYGDADPTLTGALNGFLPADGVTATYSRTAGETVAGSPYTISATLSPAGVLGNYAITYNTANFTITKRAASVTPTAASKIYGDADPALTGTLNGFVAGDGVTATYSRTAGETVAGNPYTISAALSPTAVLANYTITYNTASFTIDKRPASVTPNAATKIYGGTDPALTGTLGGFVAADSVTASYSRTAGETVAGSPYTISATLSPAGVLGNYAITYNTANFTITKATLTVTADNKTKILNATNPPLTAAISGFKNGETLATSGVTGSPSLTVSATTTSPVGSYPITASLGTLNATNYTFAFVSGALSIMYAPVGLACNGDAGHQILQPINADGSSVFKQKSTVPAKFRVCDVNGDSIGTPGVVTSFNRYYSSAGTATEIDEMVDSTTPDTAFRWSSSDQQWIFNISTKSLSANVTYYYRITVNDGSTIEFQFGLK
jgi:hypothetical protein